MNPPRVDTWPASPQSYPTRREEEPGSFAGNSTLGPSRTGSFYSTPTTFDGGRWRDSRSNSRFPRGSILSTVQPEAKSPSLIPPRWSSSEISHGNVGLDPRTGIGLFL